MLAYFAALNTSRCTVPGRVHADDDAGRGGGGGAWLTARLFEILLMTHQLGQRRLGAMNARAVDEHVNLAVTLDVAEYDTVNGSHGTRCRTAGRRRATRGRS